MTAETRYRASEAARDGAYSSEEPTSAPVGKRKPHTNRLAWPAKYVIDRPPTRAPEGSNLWLTIAQLEHGPLGSNDVAELLDVSKHVASSLIHRWQKLRYVRRLLSSEAQPAAPEPPKPPKTYDVGASSALTKVLAFVRQHGRITTAEVMRVTGKCCRDANSRLSKWVAKGILVRVSKSVYEESAKVACEAAE